MYRALNVLIGLNGNSSTQGAVAQMFSTHPDSAKRATRIKEMAEAAGYKLNAAGGTSGTNGSNSNSGSSSGASITPKNGGSTSGSTNNSGSGGKTVKIGKN